MNFYFNFCAIILFALVIYLYLDKNKFNSDTNLYSDHLFFAVGILSARGNFVLREALRLTWLSQYFFNDDSTKIWFIIGKDDCQIPPEYRLSEYGCDKWNINISGLSSHFYTSHKIHSSDCQFGSKKVFYQGFSFKVHHPLIVKKLGILFDLLIPDVVTKVAILDIQSKEIVVQANISRNVSYLSAGYVYEDVENILLPKNYEGMVLVEGYLQHEVCADITWNDGGGVMTFNRIYSTPFHIDSLPFSDKVYSAASIYFDIHDLTVLKSLAVEEEGITHQWLSKLKNLNDKLTKESFEKQDILFVNVTDTYRNLPIKLLHFYKWINQNYKFSYLMKTDDDTVVDFPLLTRYVKNLTVASHEPWIWSRFRHDWPVNYVGKWSDYEYRSSIYPTFPCGATYVMSHKTVQWLSLNADYLFPYQGEDVSMGIWLSAIKPNFINDNNFECDTSCSKNSYNRAQLTEDDIYTTWSFYQTCQNLCSCDLEDIN